MEQITREEMIELLKDGELLAEATGNIDLARRHGPAIASLQAAEPVGYISPLGIERLSERKPREQFNITNNETAVSNIPLFTLPCPPTKAQVPDALREIAGWMEDGGPTWHEAEMIGMEVSGAVGVSSAKRCTEAARRAFLEAARIWEYMHRDEMLTASPAPERHDGWVIADNPPTANGEYLVHYSGAVFAAEYKFSSNRWVFGSGMGAEELTGITHWMPKPPPPQQEEAER